ncbi:MAG: endonuclease/exonuclease/phosphatase family protein [Hahellaceae bacterium]|nr:endonuclease/exonuclease/phosphatase family protein [Hahellaceae bacterium]MCP5170479.1 endonuclease/exonuclease/phosphatase family protein [Hahellaceae bacterium]
MYHKMKSKLRDLVAVPEVARVTESDRSFAAEFEPHRHLRLLSFNIQVGISTSSYHHYLTRSWQHFLPHQRRTENLNRIAGLLQQYDVVALQEVDGGSLRSGFVNQVQFLAEASGFPYWYQQLNRNLGKFAQHSNGLLSRYRPLEVESHRLPGVIPGRGAIMVRYGDHRDPLVLVMMHLSLGKAAQVRQLSYVRELIKDYRHVVLMGDMNSHAEQLLEQTPLKGLDLVPLPGVAHTFPSWRPDKALDHILVSPSLSVRRAGVVPYPVSDHLPIALDVALPQGYLESFGGR